MKRRNLLLALVGVAIVVAVMAAYVLANRSSQEGGINSFEECAAAGNPIMESYPRRCNANGETFTEVIE